jgi:hypothetical protein
MASLAGLFIARIVESVVDQADGLQGGIHVSQLNPVVRFIQPYELMLEMTGLAVNPQMRSVGGAFPVSRVAIATLSPDGCAMRRPRHIGMTMNTGDILMRIAVKGLGGHLQRYILSVNGAAAVGFGMAIVAKRFG